MKRFILIISLLTLASSCNTEDNSKPAHTTKEALVDIRDAEKSVNFLCQKLERLTDTDLSDEEYKQLQIQVEALYLGLEFGLKAGFYTNQELIKIADSINCVI